MIDRVTKMVNGLLPDGTLIRACEVTFDYLEKQDDRIAKLVEENGVLFAANVRLNSRADLDSGGYADRIEKLEAALELARCLIATNNIHSPMTMEVINEALEGKDD